MGDGKFSVSRILRLFGCLVFDVAVIIAFFKVFALFSILAPVKAILMVTVLLIGLVIFNATLLFPEELFNGIGIAYSIPIVILLIMYAVVANVLSMLLIVGSVTWYIVLELTIMAVFLTLCSLIVFFSKRTLNDIEKNEMEEIAKKTIIVQLVEIEGAIFAKQNVNGMLPIIGSFKQLKERINASTPFGRITGNSAVIDVENTIKSNLNWLNSNIQANLTENNLVDIKKLLDDTLRLVISREVLNIK